MSLFAGIEAETRRQALPLAARMRPRTLAEFVGQDHLLAQGRLLRRLLDSDCLTSVVLYGPPGIGKTSLAELIARHTQRRFVSLNAAAAGVKELRDVLDAARQRLEVSGERTVLFVDELHHFNKTQQNVLLPDVEQGVVALVAATTANPFFALIGPLLSRSQLFELKLLTPPETERVLHWAMSDRERGLAAANVTAAPDALAFLAHAADGDVRKALGALEVAVLSLPAGGTVTPEVARESIQKKILRYDNHGDEHYDTASAYIKSLRGADPDAALYWLARMLESGEDPRFVSRRLMIAAAEDVGNADPQALVVATAAAQATEMIGMPECRIILAQATAYVALAPKSNASYQGIEQALDDVRHDRMQPVPMALRDRNSGAGRGTLKDPARGTYTSPHENPTGRDPQQYLGVPTEYYHPVDRGFEVELGSRLATLRQARVGSRSSQVD